MGKLLEVSLCMIVKNEERFLYQCLDSIKDIVDEIIIVDTGSTDKTVEIAKQFGAIIKYFNWNGSFSEARNYSLSFATKEWIFIMDADDKFDENDKEKFRMLIQQSTMDGHFFKTLSYSGNLNKNNIVYNQNLRLLRNNRGYQYTGKIHEQISNRNGQVNFRNFSNENINIYHYGYLSEIIVEKDKRTRNMEIIKQELAVDPDNKFQKYNLGLEYFSLSEINNALKIWNELYKEIDFSVGYGPKLVLKRVLCFYEIHQYAEALKAIEEGLIIYPQFTDLEYLRGCIHYDNRKYLQAIDSFNKCFEMGDAPINLAIIKGCSDIKPLFNLAKVYDYLKDYEKAIKSYEGCIALDPNNYSYLFDICRVLKKENLDNYTIRDLMLKYFHEDFKENYKLIAYIFIKEGFFDIGYEYIEKSLAYKYDSQVYFLLGRYYFFAHEYENAYNTFNELVANDEDNIDCIRYMILIHFICKEPQKAQEELGKVRDTRKNYQLFFERIIEFLDKGMAIDEKEKEINDELFKIIDELISLREFSYADEIISRLKAFVKGNIHLKLMRIYQNNGLNHQAVFEALESIKNNNEVTKEVIDVLSSYYV